MKSLATYEITDRVRFIRRGWADVGATGTVVANSHLNLGTLIIKLDERGSLIEAHRDWLIMFRIEDGYFAMATEEDVEPISSEPIRTPYSVGDRVRVVAKGWAPAGATGRICHVSHELFGPFVIRLDDAVSVTYAPLYWLQRWDIPQGCFALARETEIEPI